MPFVPLMMTNLEVAKAASQKIVGTRLLPEVSAIASAVCTYLATAPVLRTTNTVIGPGSGTYTGRIYGLFPSMMSSLMMQKAFSKRFSGRDMRRFFDAVSFGVCNMLQTVVLAQGTVIGGGPGAGTGMITNLRYTDLKRLIMINLAGRKLFGSKTDDIMSAVAYGICTHIMFSGIVQTVCVGAFSPPPAGPVTIPAAPGLGKLI